MAACSPDAGDDGLTVFAAASLRVVSEELEAAWTAEHPDLPLTMATEASNVLAARISEGARADVFLSADPRHPRELTDEGLTSAEPATFARNRVALVVPIDAGRISTPADLAIPGTRIIVAGPSTPIGSYTAEVVAAIAATMPEPEAFAAAVEANIASREDNVRAALTKVELGEGDAAFVYHTDATGSEAVRTIELPAARVTAEYDAVQLSDRAAAAALVTWLQGPEAAAILKAAGFEVSR